MYKPFALAPCGHITCYNCLIRWFTALQNPNAAGVANNDVDEVQLIVNSAEARRGTYLRRCKTCPVCRAAVLQRPVEMWSIKAMVATLVSSDLVDLPLPIAPPKSTTTTPAGTNNNGDANNDPWRNIFYHNPRQGPLVQNQADHEHVGMYDIEDGGIYRCIDCFHEIWGGVCSGCNRGYPGHEGDVDDYDNDDDSENQFLQEEARRHDLVQQALNNGEFDEEEEDYDQFWDEGDGNHPHVNLHHHPIHPHDHLFLNGDGGLTDSEGEGDSLQEWGIFNPFQPAFFGPPPLEGIVVDEGSDEEHESDYGGSFIDDNEEEGEGIMDDGHEVFELDASSDEEEYARPSRLLQQRRRPLVVVSEDEEEVVDLDDDEANDSDLLARYLGRRTRNSRRRAATLSIDDSRSSGEEHDDNEESIAEGNQRFEVFLSEDE